MSFMEEVVKLERDNETFALAIIIESKGSTPRHAGKMIVYLDGSSSGTIGGGAVEYYVIQESVKAIQQGQSKIVSYTLTQDGNDSIGMHCGGTVKVFIEVYTTKPELVIIGGGHIGFALSKLADYLSYSYVVVDDRANYCTKKRFPSAKSIFTHENIVEAIKQAKPTQKSYVTIFTKDCDDIALQTALQYPCAYIGMIGSKRKVMRIFDKLRAEGITNEQLSQVHSPIGIDINAETPEEIAISIIAEIIKEKS
ncbi:XdhC family protein [Desulfuribacillus alkaliarsenatis]|uniref:Xanthine dehydrogenase n=1 Tax=Desulfuribacillus alkaliarsenatis TaxID=766136 RepID=A0A1E5G5K3_9FIRM|nr:XdhC/CoxI family protein [Desulfuribacillus alkaliarsenatis]OEF98375.1 hypothetical protein BHF68_01475 [Desulfuribacillus alkaliarsenatis]